MDEELSLYIIKRFRHRRAKNGEGGGSPGGRIVLSPPKARNFWVCLKFGFIRLQGFWVIGDRGALRTLRTPSLLINK